MQENLIDGKNRIREETRTVIETYCRERDERILHQATVSTFDWFARQTLSHPRRESLFRRSKDDRQKTPKDTIVYTSEIEVPRFPGLHIRLVSGAPYYIN